MAPKFRYRLADSPPSASPSQDLEEEEQEDFEEVEQESFEEGVESEEEQENEYTLETPQKSKKSGNSQKQPSVDGSETDDDETNCSSTAPNFTIKPIVNKNQQPMDLEKSSGKRALIDAEENEDSPRTSKKSRVVKNRTQENGEEITKKAGPACGRVWNEDDEIAVLESMIEYQKQKGVDAHADMGAFLEFVKGRFGLEVSRTQLYDKSIRLKNKFFASLKKGESYVPTKPHEIKCFLLSKKVWGGGNEATGAGSNGNISNGEVVGDEADDSDDDDAKEDIEEEFSSKYPHLFQSLHMEVPPLILPEYLRRFMIDRISSIDSEIAREFDESWKRLLIKELDLHCSRLEFMAELTRLVRDA